MFQKYLMVAVILAMAAPAVAQDTSDEPRQAVPRGSRPQGDNPRVGTAVPRSPRENPPPARRGTGTVTRSRGNDGDRNDRRDRGRTVIVTRPPVYSNYYYYPRRAYPYGYGAFGLGYFYYDPYRWYPGGYSTYAGSGYYSNSGRYGYGFDIGELRLQVSPRNAQVFVDGYYAGTVDDYDGMFQALKLESGPYSIRLSAPGYQDLTFDVRIIPGQKVNYRADLQRVR